MAHIVIAWIVFIVSLLILSGVVGKVINYFFPAPKLKPSTLDFEKLNRDFEYIEFNVTVLPLNTDALSAMMIAIGNPNANSSISTLLNMLPKENSVKTDPAYIATRIIDTAVGVVVKSGDLSAIFTFDIIAGHWVCNVDTETLNDILYVWNSQVSSARKIKVLFNDILRGKAQPSVLVAKTNTHFANYGIPYISSYTDEGDIAYQISFDSFSVNIIYGEDSLTIIVNDDIATPAQFKSIFEKYIWSSK